MSILLVLLVFSISIAPNSAIASSPVPGSPCKKQGRVQIIDQKLYKCTKYKKQLLWSAGKNTKVSSGATRSTSKYWIDKSCSFSKGDCPQLSNNELFPEIRNCKISDATRYRPPGASEEISGNGFPRPTISYKNVNKPLVGIIPVSFIDFPFTPNLESQLSDEYAKAIKFYAETSYGSANISFETIAKKYWISIPYTWKEWSTKNNDDLVTITKSIIAYLYEVDLQKYDSIFFGTSKSTSFYWGGGTQEIYENSFGKVKNVYFTVGGRNLGLEHNLGHTLYLLEDLYVHPWNVSSVGERANKTIRYDIMSGGENYSGWNRWLNGWLTDQDVSCLPTGEKTLTVRINFLEEKSGKRLLVIPESQFTGIFIEYRGALNKEGKGILLYRLNSEISHGYGPIEGTPDLISSGESKDFYGYRFKVIGGDDVSAYLLITKI